MSKELDEYMKEINGYMEEVRLIEKENEQLKKELFYSREEYKRLRDAYLEAIPKLINTKADLDLANKALDEATLCEYCHGKEKTLGCSRSCTGRYWNLMSPESIAYAERVFAKDAK